MKWRHRLQSRFVAGIAVAIIGVFVVGFASLAAFLALRVHVSPVLAALLVAGALLVLALVILLAANLAARPRRTRASQRDSHPMDALEAALKSHTDPALSDLIRRHPDKAAATMLLLGIAAGYSRTVRRMVHDFSEYLAELDERRDD